MYLGSTLILCVSPKWAHSQKPSAGREANVFIVETEELQAPGCLFLCNVGGKSLCSAGSRSAAAADMCFWLIHHVDVLTILVPVAQGTASVRELN